jgi:Xaa-Pro aminopeptidase
MPVRLGETLLESGERGHHLVPRGRRPDGSQIGVPLVGVQGARPGPTLGIIAETGFAAYAQPWAIGHQLGFGLHGEPVLGPGVDVPLQAGMVVNIEPSLYTFDDLAIGGVELEDTILVTDTGSRRLTDFPYEPRLLA